MSGDKKDKSVHTTIRKATQISGLMASLFLECWIVQTYCLNSTSKTWQRMKNKFKRHIYIRKRKVRVHILGNEHTDILHLRRDRTRTHTFSRPSALHVSVRRSASQGRNQTLYLVYD